VSATICINDGNTHNTPIESLENQILVLVRKYALRQDSGAAGRQRGGLGVVKEYEVLAPLRFNSGIELTKCAPWGLAGGHAGEPNAVELVRAGRLETFPNGRLASAPLAAADRIRLLSGGGGGFGPPVERDVGLLASDVQNGYVSVDAAAQTYRSADAGQQTSTTDPSTIPARRPL